MNDESMLEKISRTVAETARELKTRFFGQQITVFPSYGHRDPAEPETWIVPMRLWVHDDRDLPFVERVIESWAARHFEEDLKRPLTPDERARLDVTLAPFIADDKDDEAVEFRFSGDTREQWFPFSAKTTPNGVIEERVRIPDALVQELMHARGGEHWLDIEARTVDGNGRGEGAIRFLEAEGWSIISDIDDTIKLTLVSAGKKTILRNTFLHPFRAAPGMRERYEGLAAEVRSRGEDLCFHYVSGSPWQLFSLLHEFLIEKEGFPAGVFHMKNLRKNLLEPGAFDSLRAFILGGDLATLDQKVRQITNLMLCSPRRKFILIGDSGEKDPEAYRAIQRLFPQQVKRIIIRDVLGARLSGMELISGQDVSVSLDTSALENEMLALVEQASAESAESERL